MQEIPIQKAPFFTENLLLDGINYRFDFKFDDFKGFWYISIYDYLDNTVIQGKRIVLNNRMFQKLTVWLWGFLLAYSEDTTKDDITYEDLTEGKVKLYWISPEETVNG